MRPVTVNADLGESYGIHTFGNDEALVELIDAANIACGYHAGDPHAMRQAVRACVRAGVKPGAHPGLPDPVGFGRRSMRVTADEVRDLALYQVGALAAFAEAEGGRLSHIKPHGALYAMLAEDGDLMHALCDVAVHYGLPVYGLAGSRHEEVALERDVGFVSELYVDLDYRDDGSLVVGGKTRRRTPADVTRRLESAFADGTVQTVTGKYIDVRFTSICVHSDTPNAVEIARSVVAALGANPPDAT